MHSMFVEAYVRAHVIFLSQCYLVSLEVAVFFIFSNLLWLPLHLVQSLTGMFMGGSNESTCYILDVLQGVLSVPLCVLSLLYRKLLE